MILPLCGSERSIHLFPYSPQVLLVGQHRSFESSGVVVVRESLHLYGALLYFHAVSLLNHNFTSIYNIDTPLRLLYVATAEIVGRR